MVLGGGSLMGRGRGKTATHVCTGHRYEKEVDQSGLQILFSGRGSWWVAG